MRDNSALLTLFERAAHGDGCAWNHLVRRYTPLVDAACRHSGISGADADDIGSTVWLRLLTRLTTIREPAALPGWLTTVTRNECHALHRRGNREISTNDLETIESNQPAPDNPLLQHERLVALREAVAQLPPRERRLLAMLFSDPPTPYSQISSALNMPIGAIGPTRQRCLARLRRSSKLTALDT